MDDYIIKTLSSEHQRESFCSGVESLDTYLKQQANQAMKKYVSVTFVMTAKDDSQVIGYYTLSSTSILLDVIPDEYIKKLPKYPDLPATLLGRLAVDKSQQGQGCGELLLLDAFKRSYYQSQEIASMAVVVDATNDSVIEFYQRYGFIKTHANRKLFLPMGTIKKIDFESLDS